MTTRRMSHGMAISPAKDESLLAEMARKGQRLTGMNALGQYVFTDAEPEEKVFTITHRAAKEADDDWLATFAAAGWEHVLGIDFVHVFKADPGTAPIHTDPETRRDEVRDEVRRYARYSVVAVVLALLVMGLLVAMDAPSSAWAIAIAILAFPVVYTVFPLVGATRRLLAD